MKKYNRVMLGQGSMYAKMCREASSIWNFESLSAKKNMNIFVKAIIF